MNSIHLTDEVLQAYLLKEMEDDTLVAHLTICATCRKRLEEYQLLLERVQEIRTETFSFNVTDLAMDTIMLYEQKKRNRQALFFWGLLIFLVIVISSLAVPFIPGVLAVFNSKSVITSLLIIGTGIAVLFFLLADVMQQYKMKEEQLFKNNLQPKRRIAV